MLFWVLFGFGFLVGFFSSFGVCSRNGARPNVLFLQASQKSLAHKPEATQPFYYHPASNCRESPPIQTNPLCAQVSPTGERALVLQPRA